MRNVITCGEALHQFTLHPKSFNYEEYTNIFFIALIYNFTVDFRENIEIYFSFS